jgi:hypothetical protein
MLFGLVGVKWWPHCVQVVGVGSHLRVCGSHSSLQYLAQVCPVKLSPQVVQVRGVSLILMVAQVCAHVLSPQVFVRLFAFRNLSPQMTHVRCSP